MCSQQIFKLILRATMQIKTRGNDSTPPPQFPTPASAEEKICREGLRPLNCCDVAGKIPFLSDQIDWGRGVRTDPWGAPAQGGGSIPVVPQPQPDRCPMPSLFLNPSRLPWVQLPTEGPQPPISLFEASIETRPMFSILLSGHRRTFFQVISPFKHLAK